MISPIACQTRPFFTPAPPWSGLHRSAALPLPASQRRWLTDTGSLTLRLSRMDQRQFSVTLVSERQGRASPIESRDLGLPTRAPVWIREVLLLLDDDLQVEARTVIPMRYLRQLGNPVRRLGNRSLGSFLFRHPQLQRQPMRFCRQPAHKSASGRLQAPITSPWCRRSVFQIGTSKLLVSEAFASTLLSGQP